MAAEEAPLESKTSKSKYFALPHQHGKGDSRKIHWVQPAIMGATFLGGIALVLGHHFFYIHWDGRQVTSTTEQQWIIRGGTAFAFCIKILLVLTASQAFVQQLWLILEEIPFKMSSVDRFFAVLGNPLEFADVKLWLQVPLLAAMAVIAW